MALASHPNARIQAALEESALAGVDSADWQFFPTPSVAIERVNARTGDPSYPGDGTVSTLRLQQPLWAGGRLTAGKEKAVANAASSRASVEDVRKQLAQRVVQAYSDWLAADLKIKANAGSLDAHARLRDQVRRRAAQGLSAESDLTLAIGRHESVNADLVSVRAQQEIARLRLAELTGQAVDDASLGAIAAVPQSVASDIQVLVERGLGIDPAIKRAEAQARQRAAVIDERRADLSPDVYLRAERQYGNYSVRGAQAESRVFLGLSTRFGAGLSAKSAIDVARLEHRAALAEVEAQQRNVREQIISDHALSAASEARRKALDVVYDSATQVADSYRRQFLAGRKSWQEVMNASREVTQIQIQQADTYASQLVSSWRLAMTTGALDLGALDKTPVVANAVAAAPAAAPVEAITVMHATPDMTPAPAPDKAPGLVPVKAGVAEVKPGQWVIKLGSYKSVERAQEVARLTHTEGFPVYFEEDSSSGVRRTKPRAGPFDTREAAEHAARTLARLGLEGNVRQRK